MGIYMKGLQIISLNSLLTPKAYVFPLGLVFNLFYKGENSILKSLFFKKKNYFHRSGLFKNQGLFPSCLENHSSAPQHNSCMEGLTKLDIRESSLDMKNPPSHTSTESIPSFFYIHWGNRSYPLIPRIFSLLPAL